MPVYARVCSKRSWTPWVLMFVLVLAAPTIGASPSGAITVLGWENFMRDHEETWHEALALFNEDYPDIEVTSIRTSSGEYSDQFLTMLAADMVPDVIWVDARYVVDWHLYNDLLQDLTPWIEDSSLDLEEYVARASVFDTGDRIYALGLEYFMNGYEYNKNFFDEAGVPYPDSNWTWDDFLDIARKLKREDADGRVTRWGTQVGPTGSDGPQQFIWQGGGAYWSDDKTRVTIDQSEGVNALQFVIDLMYRYQVAPTRAEVAADAVAGSDRRLRYDRGTGISMNYGRYTISRPFEWGTVVPPRGPGGQYSSFENRGWAIPRSSENHEAAWAWIEWWISPKGQEIFTRTTNRMPTHVPTIISSTRLDGWQGNTREQWFETVLALTSMARPIEVSPFDAALEPFHREMEAAWNGERSVRQAVDASMPSVRAILAQLQEELANRR